jgi:hypothetical protein
MTNDNPSAAGKVNESKAWIHPREMLAACLTVPPIGLSGFTCEGPSQLRPPPARNIYLSHLLGDAKCKYFLYSIARKIGPRDFWNFLDGSTFRT